MPGNEIAVIGMGGRFPGAPDLQTFWHNVSMGVDSVRDLTDEELRAAGVPEEAIADPTYVKATPYLEGIDMFDAGFFGMSARDAAIFDPQHRLILECAWEAFEHGGYLGEAAQGPVGVFVGCGMNEYLTKNVMANPEIMATVGEWLVRHTGNDSNFLATRISYELNLRGPSMNVQTACSSSLVAVHLACQSLLNGECDLALAGGSTIRPEQGKGYFWREGEIFARDGRTRSFDARASGTALSSAVACILLKRHGEAVRDGDNVMAVILGSAINNDGQDKVGYLAPSVSGQARVVAEALEMAEVSPEEVSYVEAHGSGTSIGDPIEITALTQAYRAVTEKRGYCALGSLKPNIGHAAEASGGAALIKTILALQHRVIPPSLHFESPNPRCEFASSPFFVNTKARAWDATRRIAGVTSLGVGGTNCHVIVEAAADESVSPQSTGPELLVLSAKTAAALETATENLAQHLRLHPAASLSDVGFTLAVGRKGFRHRRAVVARNAEEALQSLHTRDSAHVFSGEKVDESRSVAYLYPGEEAAYRGMGSELYGRFALFKNAVDESLAFLTEGGEDVRAYLDPTNAAAAGGPPSVTIPALFAVEYATGKLLASWGVSPSAVIGQGAGEYAAACMAGVLSCEQGVALAVRRGLWMENQRAGSAEGTAPPEVHRSTPPTKPHVRLVSAHTGEWVTDARMLDEAYWGAQIRSAGRFDEGMRVLTEDGRRTLIEVGPRGTRSGQSVPAMLPTLCRPEGQGLELASLLASAGRLWATGDMALTALYEARGSRRVPLPTYPWQRQRYWLEPNSGLTGEQALAPVPAPRRAALPLFERPDLSAPFVAPRTSVEAELATIWRELLGVKQVGVHDDFFELGGQSVVAVRFFTRVRKTYGVDLPLSTLLEASTIEKCAAVVASAVGDRREEGTVPEEGRPAALDIDGPARAPVVRKSRSPRHEFRSLVPIQPGDERTPFFCVHGAGGNILNLRDLSRAMGNGQPFYGLQARGIDGVLPPHESIEDMATAYLAEIRALRPQGPYVFGGYSGGGLVALEMARRVTAAGERVELLALIDTMHPEIPVRIMTPRRRLHRIREEGADYLPGAVRRWLMRRAMHRGLAKADAFAARGEVIPPELREFYLERSFKSALARYRPGPWRGRAILFRPGELEYIYRDARPDYGWEDVIHDIEIAHVPGDHATILLGSHAPLLREALERAIGTSQGGEVGGTQLRAELDADAPRG
jgi:acyl transferase domain-containing protein/thioesterase domain-containing protein